MECSLRFDQHLHNGDPLTARTKNVPKDRPAKGNPPFSWEEGARDALDHDRLLGITDWSLESVLYHWHRYNGINNAYKRNNIPTPYLWSGSKHYRKGKYFRDGVFDLNAVSKQVGAAVLLKALDELNVIKVKSDGTIVSNSETASGSSSTISLPLSGTAFTHIKKELAFPVTLSKGSGGSGASATEKYKVRQLQEWLILNGINTGIDGDFGNSTKKQLTRFQVANGRPSTGVLDEETWVQLTNPMLRAFAPINHTSGTSLEEAIVSIAKQHIAEKPEEVGGNNKGPWVRFYMKGKQGSAQKWCAGFVCFIIAQASRDLGISIPFPRHVGVDQLVADAKADDRFIRGTTLNSSAKRHSTLCPGMLFTIRRTSTDWTHVGIILDIDDNDFDTLEGNTDRSSSTDGANAKIGNRAYSSKDFLKLF